MIAKMIIDIRYENAKDHPTVQLFGVTFRSRTVLAEFVHNFRVACTFAITELPHGDCRKEWQPEINHLCGRNARKSESLFHRHRRDRVANTLRQRGAGG